MDDVDVTLDGDVMTVEDARFPQYDGVYRLARDLADDVAYLIEDPSMTDDDFRSWMDDNASVLDASRIQA